MQRDDSSNSHEINPYASPQTSCKPAAVQQPTLLRHGWLYRKVQLPEPMNSVIEYRGGGVGFETILVNGVVANRKISWLWFVPHFDFILQTDIGDLDASVDVSVAPWCAIRSFEIRIKGEMVYSEI